MKPPKPPIPSITSHPNQHAHEDEASNKLTEMDNDSAVSNVTAQSPKERVTVETPITKPATGGLTSPDQVSVSLSLSLLLSLYIYIHALFPLSIISYSVNRD